MLLRIKKGGCCFSSYCHWGVRAPLKEIGRSRHHPHEKWRVWWKGGEYGGKGTTHLSSKAGGFRTHGPELVSKSRLFFVCDAMYAFCVRSTGAVFGRMSVCRLKIVQLHQNIVDQIVLALLSMKQYGASPEQLSAIQSARWCKSSRCGIAVAYCTGVSDRHGCPAWNSAMSMRSFLRQRPPDDVFNDVPPNFRSYSISCKYIIETFMLNCVV